MVQNLRVINSDGIWHHVVAIGSGFPTNTDSLIRDLKRFPIGSQYTDIENRIFMLRVAGNRNVADFKAVNEFPTYKTLTRVAPFFYEAKYENLDYVGADEYFKKYYKGTLGRCSSIGIDGFLGRNLDWWYSNLAEFVITTPATDENYATLCVGGNSPELTDEFVKLGVFHPRFKWLPFTVADGINSEGVCCSVNVSASSPDKFTTGTNPGKPDLCGLMIVRYILDKHSSAKDAVEDIRDNWNVYMPLSASISQELHFIVKDSESTYLLEFIGNETYVKEISDKPYITNFPIFGTSCDTDGHILPASVDPYGQGLERYNIIADNISAVTSASKLWELLELLRYTRAYSEDENPIWKTEFTGDFVLDGVNYPLRVTDGIEKFMPIINKARLYFQHRDRNNPNTWHTQHQSVYDIANKKLTIAVQELEQKYEYSLGV